MKIFQTPILVSRMDEYLGLEQTQRKLQTFSLNGCVGLELFEEFRSTRFPEWDISKGVSVSFDPNQWDWGHESMEHDAIKHVSFKAGPFQIGWCGL